MSDGKAKVIFTVLSIRQINEVHNFYQQKGGTESRALCRVMNKRYIKPALEDGKQNLLIPAGNFIALTIETKEFQMWKLSCRKR